MSLGRLRYVRNGWIADTRDAYCARMTDPKMFTELDADLLADAFPQALRADALKAAEAVLRQLHSKQWTERFEVHVAGEGVQLPARLDFASDRPLDEQTRDVSLIVRCLQTRSNNGFQRQRAVQGLLADIRPWSAPFVTALIGEYVIEILHDIHAGLSRPVSEALAAFISANPTYWERTQQRVASYWNAYYRISFGRSDYVGFKLIDALGAAVRANSVQAD
jgi:hypothetical protein